MECVEVDPKLEGFCQWWNEWKTRLAQSEDAEKHPTGPVEVVSPENGPQIVGKSGFTCSARRRLP